MGNQQTREPFNGIQNANLTEEQQDQIENMLWISEWPKFRKIFKEFQDKHASGLKLEQVFNVNMNFKPTDTDSVMNEQKRVLTEVIQRMTYGFSTSEKKLDELQQGDFRNFEFKTIPFASASEMFQQKKSCLLIALYLSKNKGGGAKSRQTLLEFFKEHVKNEGSKNAQLSLRIGSIFNPKHPLTKLQDTHIESYYAVLKEQIKEMLGSWHEADSLDFHSNIFEVDMQMIPVRDILVQALEDDTSGKSDDEVKSLSLRLLTRIAMLTKNPETLLMASYFQKKLNVDITHEIKPYLGEAERFEKPEKEINADDFGVSSTTLKEKVQFVNSEDVSLQMTQTYDAFAEDKDHIFCYNELRGMSRAVKSRTGGWKQVDVVNSDCKGLKCVSMVLHEGKLLVRHADQKDSPFEEYDKDTLKPVATTDETRYKHPEGDDDAAKRSKLDWSEVKLDKEEDDEEEKQQTEEQKAEEEKRRPRRRMGATPLASDGKNLYALSFQVKQEEDDKPVEHQKLTVEVFEIAENNVVKQSKTIVLKKSDDDDYQYSGKRYTTDGGVLNHAQITCNGRVFVLNLPHRTHFFKVEGGVRFKVTDKRPELSHFNMVYNADLNTFSGFITDAFQGAHMRLTIKGFEKKKTEEEIKKELVPEVLKSGKDKISGEIDKSTEKVKEPEKLNMYEQLIEGVVDTSKILEKATENLKLRKQTKIKNVHELTQAIILTTMAQKADQFEVDLDALGQNSVIGEELLKYFRKDDCIFLTKTMFKFVEMLISDLHSELTSNNVSIYSLASLSSLIRLTRTNLRCLAICKINLKEVITEEQYSRFLKLRSLFDINFAPTLTAAIKAKADEEKAACEQRAKEKEEKAKLEEEKETADEDKKSDKDSKAEEVKAQEDVSQPKISEPITEKSGDADDDVKDGISEKNSDKKSEKDKDEEESEQEEEDEDDDKEKLEQKWKNAEHYATLLIKQANELDGMLSNIIHSVCPLKSIKELGDNIKKAREGDNVALKACYDVFDALTNNKSMDQILRGSQEEFVHVKEVIKVCLDLTEEKELKVIRSESDQEGSEIAKLRNYAALFTKCYFRQQNCAFADLLFEVKETDVPPKKEPKEGEEPEEEDDEMKEKRKRNEMLKAQLEVLKPQLFHSFISLTESYSSIVDSLVNDIAKKVSDSETFLETLDIASGLFEKSDCLLKNIKVAIWFFNFIQIETTWLDEVAEGLKNVVSSADRCRNFFDGLPVSLQWKAKQSGSWDNIIQTMRQALYTLGSVASQLITPQDEAPKDEEKEKKEGKVDFSKLIMLQGGLESRFIPELSDETKTLIEGFFKITQDHKLRDLALMKKDQVELNDDDLLLKRILKKSDDPAHKSIDGIDYVEQTLEVLQHAVGMRKGPILRVGGQDGMRLSRAAFAVIVKFCEQVPLFQSVWDELEMQSMSIDSDTPAMARNNQLIAAIKESKAHEFEVLCKQWEQASQIRKWTQEMKKDLTESIKKEVTEEFMKEISEKMKKEKEEKREAEEKEKEEDDQKEKSQEESKTDSSLKEESKTEESKQPEVEETKSAEPPKTTMISTTDDKKKKEESKDEKAEDKDDDDDDESFSGPLTPDQEEEVESRVFKKMQEKMTEAIESAIKKCELVLKMRLPQAFQQTSSEEMQRQLSRKLSQNLKLENKGSSLVRAPSIKKRQSILLVENTTHQTKDTEFDWKDRLKQWNQVQLSLGTITSFSQLGDKVIKSIPLSVISLMQSKFSAQKMIEEVEKVMIRGLRRSAGLNLLAFGINTNIGPGTLMDLVQWFMTSLKGNRHRVGHYSDKIKGCGDSILASIRTQFFKVIEVIITHIRATRESKHIIHMLNALIWDYKGSDLDYLAKFNIVDVIQFGDGGQTHPIRLAWGKQLKQTKQSDDMTLTRTVVNFFEFLFKQVLSQVILIDAQGNENGEEKKAKSAEAGDENISFETSRKLASQFFDAIFSNLQRYIKISEMIEPDPQKFFLQLNNSADTVVQELDDKLADVKLFIEDQGGDEKVKKDVKRAEMLNLIKFNAVISKINEQEADGKQDYAARLATLMSSKIPECSDTAEIIRRCRVRDESLKLEINQCSFEDLALSAPSEEEIQCAIKESSKNASDDTFKEKYAQLQELLKSLNMWLVNNENASVDGYKHMYKRFAQSLPELWLSSLGLEELQKFWKDGENFAKQEFLEDSKCQGISELHCCLSKEVGASAQPEEKKDDEEDENKAVERRTTRKELCKKCFWVGVLIRVLEEAPQFEKTGAFNKVVSNLPSSCEALNHKPDELIQVWAESIPKQAASSDKEAQPDKLTFKEQWYILLPKVERPNEEAENRNIEEEDDAEDSKEVDSELKLTKQLKKMRNTKPVAAQKSKLTSKNMYHETFFFKVLGLMDFYTSLAMISPAALALVQQFANPQKLNILVQLLICGLSRGKFIVLRIFQDLMKLDFPTEIFDRAVEISLKAVKEGKGNAFDQILSLAYRQNANFDLSNFPFFNLIFSMILSVHEMIYRENLTANKGRHALSLELTRVFKSLPQNGEKNLFVQKLIASKIKETLLKIETYQVYEIEAIMSIINETASNQIQVGSACVNQQNQVFTVIGFSSQDLVSSKKKPEDMDLAIEFDPTSDKQNIFGLYYDPNSPERQEIIDCKAREANFVRDLNDVLILNAAQKSPFYSEEVVKHLIGILDGHVSCETSFVQNLLCSYIVRGFDNMVQILHNKYISFLNEIGASKQLLSYIIKGASTKFELPKDSVMTTLTQSEILVDQIRMKALLTDVSLRKSIPHTIILSETLKSCVVTIQEDSTTKYYRIDKLKLLACEESTVRNIKQASLKAGEQVNIQSVSSKQVALVKGTDLNTLSPETMKIVKSTGFVMTDDSFNLADFVTRVQSVIDQGKDGAALSKTGFFQVTSDAFQSLSSFVVAEELKLAERTEAIPGLVEDDFCQAIEKLTTAGIKFVSRHLKHLIDLKKEEGSEKTAFDIIEDKLVDLLKDQIKDNEVELAKKKKDLLTDMSKVTGKKVEDETKKETDSEKKEEENKAMDKPTEESKVDEKKPEESTASAAATEEEKKSVMIDTTDSAAKIAEAEVEEQVLPVPSNEMKSEVQRALKLDDELCNYVLCSLEMHDPDEEGDKSDKVQKNFVEATQYPKRNKAVHVLYKEEMEKLNNLQCRATFFNMLASGYKSFEEVVRDMDMSTESFDQLQDLVFNELVESQHQSKINDDEALLKACKKKIKKMYRLFFNDSTFEKFSVEDLINRGLRTIEAIRADTEFELDELTVQNLNKKFKGPSVKVSDPNAVSFLVAQMIKMEKLSYKEQSPSLIALYEIFLGISMLFGSDLTSKVSEKMLQICYEIIQMAEQQIEFIEEKDDVLERILNNNLFKWMCSGLNFESTFKVNRRKDKIMKIQTLMYKMQGMILERLSKKIEISASVNRFITDSLKQQAVFQDGKTFKYLINSMQQKALLNSEEDQLKVRDLARAYVTDKKMFKFPLDFSIKSGDELLKVHVSKINSECRIKLTTPNGGAMIFSRESLKDGIKNVILDHHSSLGVKMLPGTQMVHLGNEDYSCSYKDSDYLEKASEAELVVKKVHCAISNSFFVGESENELYGVGQPNTHNKKWEESYSQSKNWVKMEKPSDCQDFLKTCAGGSSRIILTKSGQLFCQGENLRHYVDSEVNRDALTTSFVNCTDVFPVEDDQIVDVAQGYFMTIVVTESGLCYAAGCEKYRSYYDEAIQKKQPPYQIQLPGKATRVWANKSLSVCYVEVEDDAGNKKYYSGVEFVDRYETSVIRMMGQGEQPNRYGEQDIRVPFKPMKFPEGKTFQKFDGHGYRNAWALDTEGFLWVWGQKLAYDSYYDEENTTDLSELLTGYKNQYAPCQIVWFEKKGLKVVDFSSGEWICMVLAENRQKRREMYGIIHPDYHYQAKNMFTSNAKEVFPKTIFKLDFIEANTLISFDCGSYMANFINKPMEKAVSIIPGRKTPSGITHAYKKDGEWKFIPQDEYQERKDELSEVLSYAVQYPFPKFKTNSLYLADLEETFEKIGIDETAEKHTDVTSSVSGESITKDEPLYCAVYLYNDKEKRVFLKEAEVFQEDSTFLMNPIIFYRVPKPVKQLKKLPVINLSKFYEQSSADEEQVKITVKTISLGGQSKNNYLEQMSDEKTVSHFKELLNFKNDDDRQLIKQIDKFIMAELTDKDIAEIQAEDLDFKKFDLKNENLKKMPHELLRMRSELFLKFTKQFVRASDQIDYSSKAKPGSLSYNFMKNKHFVLSSATSKALDKKLDDDFNTGCTEEITINRNRASQFATEGKVDHDGTETIFGQVFQQCKSKCARYSMFQQVGLDSSCWSAKFLGEGSIDAGGPFRESLDNLGTELETEAVPLLIKTSNNRNDHGSNRDCYMLNPASRSPTHLEMFKFLGAFIAFAVMTKNPIPLHLAPSVWKQLLNDELTMADLEGFDAYSSQVLIDLRDHSSKLPDEEFKTSVNLKFKTILSNGVEVDLKPGEELESVTKANLHEYIDLVTKTRFNESKEQIEAMRSGFKMVLTTDVYPTVQLLDYEQVENRACGQKTVDIDILKSITEYHGATEDSKIIKRFWRVLTSYDDDQRAAYLKFVWGRSRLPTNITKDYHEKHTISVCKYMNKQAFPQAHTCFFTIDIPEYPNEKVMREKILQAITLCGEIDTDGSPAVDFNGDRIVRGGGGGDESE